MNVTVHPPVAVPSALNDDERYIAPVPPPRSPRSSAHRTAGHKFDPERAKEAYLRLSLEVEEE